jgi:hypothetical protein
MPPKNLTISPAHTPAYDLALWADVMIARMEETGEDLPADPDAPLPGVSPAELAAWCEQVDRAIERRRYVVAELSRRAEHAKAEAAAWRERAGRFEAEIERVKGPALALLMARRDLGEVDKEGKVRVKTPVVSAWLISTEAVEGPEDPTQWGPYVRTRIEPDRTAAKAALIEREAERQAAHERLDADPSATDEDYGHTVASIHARYPGLAKLSLRRGVSLGWK